MICDIKKCRNCGAPMSYSNNYFGKEYTCPYCRTKYHIDLLGRIEEYKVKFEFMGLIFHCYLLSTETENSLIETTSIDSYGTSYVSGRNPTTKFEFMSYKVEKVEEIENEKFGNFKRKSR